MMGLAMEIIFRPIIEKMMEERDRALPSIPDSMPAATHSTTV
jgi:hypothetical protein